jgi:hypothetical protein
MTYLTDLKDVPRNGKSAPSLPAIHTSKQHVALEEIYNIKTILVQVVINFGRPGYGVT